MSDILIELSGWLRGYLICLTHFYKGINSTLMPFSFFFSNAIQVFFCSCMDPVFAKLFNVNVLSLKEKKLSQCMRFLTMWYVRPAKPQISLRIRAV